VTAGRAPGTGDPWRVVVIICLGPFMVVLDALFNGLVQSSGMLPQLPVHGRYISSLLSGVLPLGLGLGLTFVPITLPATSDVSGEDAGLASGLLNTAQQVGGSIGLAILSTLTASPTIRQ
jgi:hypothetical protein